MLFVLFVHIHLFFHSFFISTHISHKYHHLKKLIPISFLKENTCILFFNIKNRVLEFSFFLISTLFHSFKLLFRPSIYINIRLSRQFSKTNTSYWFCFISTIIVIFTTIIFIIIITSIIIIFNQIISSSFIIFISQTSCCTQSHFIPSLSHTHLQAEAAVLLSQGISIRRVCCVVYFISFHNCVLRVHPCDIEYFDPHLFSL